MFGQMMDYPLTISTIIDHGYATFPKKEVITYMPDGSIHRYTIADLYRRSKRLSHALVHKLGVRRGDFVGTFAWNHYMHLELYFGVPGAGAICHTINIRLASSQTEFIINNAEDACIFIDANLVQLLEPIATKLATVRSYIIMGAPENFATTLPNVIYYEDLIRDSPEDLAWESVGENEACGMCYTSGTTGLPKGVLYSHRSTCLHAIIAGLPNCCGISSADRVLVIVPQFHVMAWGLPYAAILAGSTMVMPSCLLQAEPLINMIIRENINKAGGVPTIWQNVYSMLRKNNIKTLPLKEFLVGGAAVPPNLIENFEKEFGITVIHAWGMTETSPLGAVCRLQPEHEKLSAEEKLRIQSLQGQKPPLTELRIVTEKGEIAPRDGKTVGEIEIRGAWIINSYFKTSSRENFSADGWFKTGDVGTINPEGYLQITDRAKDLIKSGGEWISSVSLEVTIMAHPLIREAAVIAIPDEVWSERPLAAVVLRDQNEPVSAHELRVFLSGSFAKYQLPDKFVFVGEIPKTSVGKFDKKKLRQLFAEGKL
ncbi:MAG TPA: long-chain fatty acid--CoA ligase [Puia sp.]|nr:long-chain fatty acid--CoA ligase [Puia sp.]